jgi:putative phosphoesterase
LSGKDVRIDVSSVAALYDVHGNLPALEAVLAQLDKDPVDAVVVGGDVVWGPMPAETLRRIRGLECPTLFIRGNADREVADGLQERADLSPEEKLTEWCRGELNDEEVRFLSTLPTSVTVNVEGLGATLFCHGSPRSDEEPITTRTSDDALSRMLQGIAENVVVCGHTHAQFERSLARTVVVNAGSVGLPFGDPGAYWALFGPGVRLRLTHYDFDAAARTFVEKGGPLAADFADHARKPPPAETAAEIFTSEPDEA